jgi:hypothetical protein
VAGGNGTRLSRVPGDLFPNRDIRGGACRRGKDQNAGKKRWLLSGFNNGKFQFSFGRTKNEYRRVNMIP